MSDKISYQNGPQEQFLSSSADVVLYGGQCGSGKAQPLDSHVLTPLGFKLMENVEPGWDVSDPVTGRTTSVLDVYPQGKLDVYRLRFDDGASVETSGDHLWTYRYIPLCQQPCCTEPGERYPPDEKPAHALASEIKQSQSWLGKNFPLQDSWSNYSLENTLFLKERVDDGATIQIPLSEPLFLSRKNEELNPYIIGLLLSTGGCLSSNPVKISASTFDAKVLLESIKFEPSGMDWHLRSGQDAREKARRINYWLEKYQLGGKNNAEKFIPDFIKRNRLRDRLCVLQGMLAVDGYIKDGKPHLSTYSKFLTRDVTDLIQSLGGKTYIRRMGDNHYRRDRRRRRTIYDVEIEMAKPSALFYSKKKGGGKRHCKDTHLVGDQMTRTLTSVEYIGKKECQCIQVSSPFGLYITDDFVVTHNSYSLLLEPLRHIDNSQFSCVIFRRTSPRITNEGGLWDTSREIYSRLSAMPKETPPMKWTFPSGAVVRFAHMEHEKNRFDWHGAQIPLIEFDELTEFTANQFFYMFSRNRSISSVRPKIRATCNPDPDSFVAELVSWWIDQDSGYPLKSRSGVLRHMVRYANDIFWFDSREEAKDWMARGFGENRDEIIPISFTFIPASVYDNKILMKYNPEYLANLKAMSYTDRMRLLYGNWFAREKAGTLFDRSWFEVVESVPTDIRKTVRFWDRAGGLKSRKENLDWTVGLKLTQDNHGTYYVEDVERFRGSPEQVRKRIKNTATQEPEVEILLSQDPGQAGASEIQYLIRELDGFNVRSTGLEKGSKLTRAKPISAQAEAGNVKVVRGSWNNTFFGELESFSGSTRDVDDQVDALSGAYVGMKRFRKTKKLGKIK